MRYLLWVLTIVAYVVAVLMFLVFVPSCVRCVPDVAAAVPETRRVCDQVATRTMVIPMSVFDENGDVWVTPVPVFELVCLRSHLECYFEGEWLECVDRR